MLDFTRLFAMFGRRMPAGAARSGAQALESRRVRVVCLSNAPHLSDGEVVTPWDVLALTVGNTYSALWEGDRLRVWDDLDQARLYPPEMFRIADESAAE